MILSIQLLMAVGVCKFVKIVQRFEVPQGLNMGFILAQIFGLVIFEVSWVGMSVETLVNYTHLGEYATIRNLLVFNIIGIFSDLLNFSIMALVIYRSPKIVQRKYDPEVGESTTMLTYLRNENIRQRHSNSFRNSLRASSHARDSRVPLSSSFSVQSASEDSDGDTLAVHQS